MTTHYRRRQALLAHKYSERHTGDTLVGVVGVIGCVAILVLALMGVI